jgi:hypothetical protein
LLIVMGGRALAAPSNTPSLRAGVLLAFAAPASFAAYHAVLGLTAIVMASDASRTIWAIVAALIVGAASWREVAMSTDRGMAG